MALFTLKPYNRCDIFCADVFPIVTLIIKRKGMLSRSYDSCELLCLLQQETLESFLALVRRLKHVIKTEKPFSSRRISFFIRNQWREINESNAVASRTELSKGRMCWGEWVRLSTFSLSSEGILLSCALEALKECWKILFGILPGSFSFGTIFRMKIPSIYIVSQRLSMEIVFFLCARQGMENLFFLFLLGTSKFSRFPTISKKHIFHAQFFCLHRRCGKKVVLWKVVWLDRCQ